MYTYNIRNLFCKGQVYPILKITLPFWISEFQVLDRGFDSRLGQIFLTTISFLKRLAFSFPICLSLAQVIYGCIDYGDIFTFNQLQYILYFQLISPQVQKETFEKLRQKVAQDFIVMYSSSYTYLVSMDCQQSVNLKKVLENQAKDSRF